MERGLSERRFHSACLLAAVDGTPILHRAYGRARLDSVFDLASLTKPLATTSVIMRLCAAGALSIGQRVDRLLPEAAGCPVGRVKLRQLLSHSSGLPAWRPYYETFAGMSPGRVRSRVRREILAELPEYPVGTRSVYSDLGFMLLGWIAERVGGRTLDVLTRQLVSQPLGLASCRFLPLGSRRQAEVGWPVVPTERHRGSLRLCGQVHDDNCRAMGGVCGHAGLFGTAHDVHLIASHIARAHRGGPSLFAPRIVRRFLDARPARASSWALGWDRPSGKRPAAGKRFSEHTVGHLGYTGTSLWIDLARQLWVVLLTNRVYHGREPNRLKAFRPRIHDAVLRAVGS